VNCPRCLSTGLDERERGGIQVDACPKCRGVWLDRGELERLIAAATSAMDAEIVAARVAPNAPASRYEPPPRSPRRRDDDHGDLDDDDDRDERGRSPDRDAPPRRRRWFQVFDIFD